MEVKIYKEMNKTQCFATPTTENEGVGIASCSGVDGLVELETNIFDRIEWSCMVISVTASMPGVFYHSFEY